jgi:hypothetical protein
MAAPTAAPKRNSIILTEIKDDSTRELWLVSLHVFVLCHVCNFLGVNIYLGGCFPLAFLFWTKIIIIIIISVSYSIN